MNENALQRVSRRATLLRTVRCQREPWRVWRTLPLQPSKVIVDYSGDLRYAVFE
jgi:hypothetical protein